jgi:hypothetical protein
MNKQPVTSVYRTPPVAFAVSPTAWSAFPGPFLFRNVDRVTVPNFAPTDVESPNCTNRFFVVVGVPAADAGPNREPSIRTLLYWPIHLTIAAPFVFSYGALIPRMMFVPAFGVRSHPTPS